MRQHKEVLQFRTPQHPSLGTNNWGGASPLLARNIPNESLEQRYLRLNTVRTRDEIFPAVDESDYLAQFYESQDEVPPTPSRRRRGILFKLLFPWKKQDEIALGSSTRKRKWLRFRRMDPRNRWPNGWC